MTKTNTLERTQVHLVAFLGTGKYQAVTYSGRIHGEEQAWECPKPVKFIQTATMLYFQEFVDVARCTIFATKEAQNEHGEGLRNEISTRVGDVRVEFRTVDAGFTEEEARNIFEEIRKTLVEEAEDEPLPILFDITHGFRSQSSSGVMVLNYLRQAPPRIRVHDITYGAFDRKFKDEPDHVFPIISLKQHWQLNEWASAFSAFQRYGRTDHLRELIKAQRNEYGRSVAGKNAKYPKFKSLPKILESWDEAIQTRNVPKLIGAPLDSKDTAIVNSLHNALVDEWEDEVTQHVGAFIKPLKDEMATILEPMRTDAAYWEPDGLRAQLALLTWLLDKGDLPAVVTIAREWLVTMVQHLLGPEFYGKRGTAERILGGWTKSETSDDLSDENVRALHQQITEYLGSDAAAATLRSAAGQLQTLRNYYNHAAMGHDVVGTPRQNPVKDAGKRTESWLCQFKMLLDAYQNDRRGAED